MTKGTKEWATKTVNFQSGCLGCCEYCYARQMADKFGWKEWDNWCKQTLRIKDINKKHKKYDGVVMIPSSHNIDRTNVLNAITVLKSLQKAGNKTLVVLKPSVDVILKLAKYLDPQLTEFRFTITTVNEDRRELFEPYTPSLEDRFNSIYYLSFFDLSISVEPFLDSWPLSLLHKLLYYNIPPEKIWIGPMNHRKELAKHSQVICDNETYLNEIYSPSHLKYIKQQIEIEIGNVNYKDGYLIQMEK